MSAGAGFPSVLTEGKYLPHVGRFPNRAYSLCLISLIGLGYKAFKVTSFGVVVYCILDQVSIDKCTGRGRQKEKSRKK